MNADALHRDNLKRALGLSAAEWRCVREAAANARMPVGDYCRAAVINMALDGSYEALGSANGAGDKDG